MIVDDRLPDALAGDIGRLFKGAIAVVGRCDLVLGLRDWASAENGDAASKWYLRGRFLREDF